MRPALRQILLGGGKSTLFADDFARADTVAPSLGTPPNGIAYGLYGPYAGSFPLPAATAGYISSGRYTADANQTVYATQNVGRKCTRFGAAVSWVSGGGSTDLSSAGLLLSQDANIVNTVGVHISLDRGGIGLSTLSNGSGFTTYGNWNASPSLAGGGVVHTIDVEVHHNTVYIWVNGILRIQASNPNVDAWIGPYPVWEVYNPSASMIDLVRFESIYAGTC